MRITFVKTVEQRPHTHFLRYGVDNNLNFRKDVNLKFTSIDKEFLLDCNFTFNFNQSFVQKIFFEKIKTGWISPVTKEPIETKMGKLFSPVTKFVPNLTLAACLKLHKEEHLARKTAEREKEDANKKMRSASASTIAFQNDATHRIIELSETVKAHEKTEQNLKEEHKLKDVKIKLLEENSKKRDALIAELDGNIESWGRIHAGAQRQLRAKDRQIEVLRGEIRSLNFEMKNPQQRPDREFRQHETLEER